MKNRHYLKVSESKIIVAQVYIRAETEGAAMLLGKQEIDIKNEMEESTWNTFPSTPLGSQETSHPRRASAQAWEAQ